SLIFRLSDLLAVPGPAGRLLVEISKLGRFPSRSAEFRFVSERAALRSGFLCELTRFGTHAFCARRTEPAGRPDACEAGAAKGEDSITKVVVRDAQRGVARVTGTVNSCPARRTVTRTSSPAENFRNAKS